MLHAVCNWPYQLTVSPALCLGPGVSFTLRFLLSPVCRLPEVQTKITHTLHTLHTRTCRQAQSVSAVLCVIGKSGKRESRLAKHNAYRPCGMKGGRGAQWGRLMCLIKLSRREQLAQLAKQIATRQVEWVEQ